MGVHLDKKLLQQNAGIYTFRVQGQIYHWMKTLNPDDNAISSLQLYFHDTDHEVQNRQQYSHNLDVLVIEKLMALMASNPYSEFFKKLTNVPDIHDFTICIKTDPGLDQRVFNLPCVS